MPDWNNFKVTIGLIAFCVIVALMSRFGEDTTGLSQLWINAPQAGGAMFYSILHGEVWRLLTPMLIHFGPLHLFFNMYWLWDLGRRMEIKEGVAKYALIIAVFGAGSSVLQYAVTSRPYFGGMSGVVYGLIGYFIARGRLQPQSGYFLGPNDMVYALIWFALGWTGYLGNIANWAHGGGLVLGLTIGAIDARFGYVRRPGR